MLITVIIPNYNYEKYIGQTLQSLLAQTYQDWECIVIDDGSQDNSHAVVNKYTEVDKRIKYIYQPNAGQASARNNGLKYARGKYIQFLDADDLLEPFKFERQIEFLEAHPEIDLVYGETRYFRNGFPEERRFSLGTENLSWMPKVSGKGAEIIERLIEKNIFTVSSPLVKKSVIDLIGEFDSRLNPIEDWDYWLRCALADISMQYLELEGTMDLIRIHSLSSSQNLRRVVYKSLLMRRKYNQLLPDNRLRGINADYLNKTLRIWIASEGLAGVGELKRGKFIKGGSIISKIIMANPLIACRIFINKISKLVNSAIAKKKINA